MLQQAAIIDLGTNTFHILVLEWEGSRYNVRKKLQIPVKLGKGAFEDKTIKAEAYQRGLTAIDQFRAIIEEYGLKEVEAYGTSALRNANNGQEFVKDAEKHLGFPIHVIDGLMEAELIYMGVKKAVPMADEVCLIMDIGGGSVEFIIADDKNIYWKKSYEIGVAKLIERYINGDPIEAMEIAALQMFLENELSLLWRKAAKYQIKTLIGASGSFESLASMEMELFHSSSQQAHFVHHILDLDLFEEIYHKLVTLPREEIKLIPGLPEFRAEMITAAVVMIRQVLHRLKIKKMIASDYALKEGVMFQIMSRTAKSWHKVN